MNAQIIVNYVTASHQVAAQKDILYSVYTTSRAESVYPLYQSVVGFNIRPPRFI